jgi:hypothetical protein
MIDLATYKVKSIKAKKYTLPTVHFDTTDTQTLKEKTEEYKQVLHKMKKLEPSATLEQQYQDMTVFDEQNKTSMILWSIITITILGVVIFRMK